MRLLLDTQVAVWWLTGAARLTARARRRITASSCSVSVASVWEVAIKHRLRKLALHPERFRDEMLRAGAAVTPVLDEHAIATTNLAIDHGDPFDRLLLATAQVDGLVFATADAALLRAITGDRSVAVLAV